MYQNNIQPLTAARTRRWCSRHQTCLVFACLCVVTFFVGTATAADDDAYLDMLEQEAESSAQLSNNPTTSQKRRPTGKPKPATANPVNKDAQIKFEQLLQFELPSTYRFYTKLSLDDQDKVVKVFIKDNKLSSASKLIFDLYFDRNR